MEQGDGQNLIKFKIISGPTQGYLGNSSSAGPVRPLPRTPYFICAEAGTATAFLAEAARKARERLTQLGIQFEEIPA
jgi:hypothetical protein